MVSWRLVSLVFGVIVGSTCGNPVEPRIQTKKFQNSINQQNLQTLLNSIEDRLRNLDTVYSMQYSPSIEGRLAHFGRKLEGMEAKITRLETVITSEIEKLLETISGRNFKDDIANDHVIRKIDNTYERLNHRMVFSEGKIDMSEKKLENKLNTILTKLDKLEDNLMVRDSDTQEEISEVFSNVEKVKTQSENVLEKLENITKGIKSIHDSHIGRNINTNVPRNTSDSFEKDVKSQIESLSTKMVNFHEYSWNTFNRMENYLRSIGLVSNQSRYEVQSGLRSLTVEVGRMAGNQHLIDNSKGREKLDELEKKMERNFNNIMSAQNTFLESCYRVQRDEAQLESKIGDVLEKLLDTFSEKTVVEPKDIRRIEQILKNHDQYMRKSSTDAVKTVATLLQKDNNFEKKFDDLVTSITNSLELLQNSINEQNTDDTVDEKLEEVMTSLKDLQSLTIDINTNVKTTIRDSIPNIQETKLLIENLQSQTKGDMIKENFKALNRILEEIRNRINLSINGAGIKNPDINNGTPIIINTTNIMNPIAFPNESNNTMVDCLDLPIDVRSDFNCNNGSIPVATVTRDPNIDRFISEIFLKNFTIPNNVTASGGEGAILNSNTFINNTNFNSEK